MIDVLSDQFILRSAPDHIRSDNGPEFVAKAVTEWIAAVGARTAYIEPGSPWENGYPCFVRAVHIEPDISECLGLFRGTTVRLPSALPDAPTRARLDRMITRMAGQARRAG